MIERESRAIYEPVAPRFTAEESFFPYVLAYYASARILWASSEDRDVLADDDAIRILSATHMARKQQGPRIAPRIRYDENQSLLQCPKDEIVPLLTHVRVSDSPREYDDKVLAGTFETFYWGKLFYRYVTKFAAETKFAPWRQRLKAFDDCLTVKDRERLNGWASRSKNSAAIDFGVLSECRGIVLHGVLNRVLYLGLRDDKDSIHLMEWTGRQNVFGNPVQEAFFQPETRAYWLQGRSLEISTPPADEAPRWVRLVGDTEWLEQPRLEVGSRKVVDTMTFGLDGITFQHMGELVFDIASTMESRRRSKAVYLACLRDFTFAMVYGEAGTIATRLPNPTDQESPGEVLRSAYDGLFRNVLAPGEGKLDDFLQKPSTVKTVTPTFTQLSAAWLADRESWIAVIHREATCYLGTHPSVLNDGDNGPIVLAKNPPYPEHKTLERAVPRHVVDEATTAVLQSTPQYERAAVNKLVSGFLLAHIGVSYWYRHPDEGVWRVPFVTRAHAHRSSMNVDCAVADLRLTLVNRLLTEFPHRDGPRRIFVDWLARQSKNPKFDDVRKYVRELDEAIRRRKPAQEINRLIAKIDDTSREAHQRVLHIEHAQGMFRLLLEPERVNFENIVCIFPELV